MKLNLEKINKKNISIIGLMGSGKSIIGKLLAKDLGFKHIDLDSMIEKQTKKTINQIFIDHGETYFRKIEEEIAFKELQKEECVISHGGGTIMSKLIRNTLKKKSFAIFLDVNSNNLYERLKNSKKRPLIQNQNIKKKIMELKKKRIKYYKKVDLIVNNSNEIQLTLKKIKNYLKKI